MIFGSWKKIVQLLVASTVEPQQRAARIRAVEKDIVLPIKGLVIAILVYYLFFSNWIDVTDARQKTFEVIQLFFFFYAGINICSGLVIASKIQMPLRWLQALLLFLGFLDGLLLTGLTSVTLGSDSILYWLFPAVILHNALTVSVALPQLLLNFFVGFCFIIGAHNDRVLIAKVAQEEAHFDQLAAEKVHKDNTSNAVTEEQQIANIIDRLIAERAHKDSTNTVTEEQQIANIIDRLIAERIHKAPRNTVIEEQRNENVVERLIVLLLWSTCCYGIQALFERQRRAEAEATEFAVRQERLHTAGRLAAEIAHQIKNPLGIITNAAYCLEFAVRQGQTTADEQIQIIREEVEKSDRILTELMGYAQLAEGRVEKLDVVEEINQALHEVFPPAAKYQVAIHKNLAASLPVLLMQRRHLNGILVNLLQNAREAMNGVGKVQINAGFGAADSIVISIEDNGPGIPPDRQNRIFEAYFTTREKGTGLGLAIVKHNAEMYGGTIRVQSELGKGTRFVLEFPSKILMKIHS